MIEIWEAWHFLPDGIISISLCQRCHKKERVIRDQFASVEVCLLDVSGLPPTFVRGVVWARRGVLGKVLPIIIIPEA